MHQNLRTTFTLSSDLLTLDKQEGKVDEMIELQKMQMLMPAQQYSTFFVLYAKFNGGVDGDRFIPESCDVFLQNYYGEVTLGLSKLDPEIDIVYDSILRQPVYTLKIHLRALHAKPRFKKPQPIGVKKDPSINNYTNLNRDEWGSILHGKNAMDTNYLLRILLYYDKLDSSIFNPNNANACSFVDTFRYERDGDELYERKYKRKEKIDIQPEGNRDGDFRIDPENGTIDTYKCRPSYVQFRTK